MKVGISQSNYIPWRGYFDLIKKCDLFVLLDDVQYTTGDWRNRNKIKTNNGVKWLTIPVGHIRRHPNGGKRICDIVLPDVPWQKDHWNKIREAYKKAEHFNTYRVFFEELYFDYKWDTLSRLNRAFITCICGLLGITTTIKDSRDYPVRGHKKERILNILKEVGATEYYSGSAAKNYITDDDFKDNGIEVHWMEYDYPDYPQLHGSFEPHVSVIDLIFNTGADALEYL